MFSPGQTHFSQRTSQPPRVRTLNQKSRAAYLSSRIRTAQRIHGSVTRQLSQGQTRATRRALARKSMALYFVTRLLSNSSATQRVVWKWAAQRALEAETTGPARGVRAWSMLGGSQRGWPHLSMSSARTPSTKSDGPRQKRVTRRKSIFRHSASVLPFPSCICRSVTACDSGELLRSRQQTGQLFVPGAVSVS